MAATPKRYFEFVDGASNKFWEIWMDGTDVTTNWRLDRLGVVDRCVLRLGAAELQRAETPPRVVIQEAVHLAERYGTLRSAKFVNGVLDALARRMGRM